MAKRFWQFLITGVKMNKFILSAFLMMLACFNTSVYSKTWPEKEIILIVPFPPGGIVDNIARSFAEDLPKVVNKPVIVKNVPGAFNVLAINELLKNDPNHTFIISIGSIVHSGIAKDNDLYKELIPNMVVGSSKITVFKNKNANTEEFLQQIRGKLPVLVAGGDTIEPGHMWLASIENANIQMIPFKGATEVIRSVIQNEPKWGMCSILCLWNFLKNDQVEVAFISSSRRSQFLPQVPTAKELGLQTSSYNFDTIYLIASNKRISSEVAEQMNAALKKVGSTNNNIQNFSKNGLDINLTNISDSAKIWAEQEKMAKQYFKKN